MTSRLFAFSFYQYIQCSLLFVSLWFILINFWVYLFLVSAIWWYQNILVQITLLWPPVWLGNCRLSVPRKLVFHSKELGDQVFLCLRIYFIKLIYGLIFLELFIIFNTFNTVLLAVFSFYQVWWVWSTYIMREAKTVPNYKVGCIWIFTYFIWL